MSEQAKVAFVTGASRGIGRASALALADAGFDVVITARTVHEGEGRSEPSSVRESVVALPGSLETTAREIEQRGRRALAIAMDLLDAGAVIAAPARALAEWGRIDVLFNNAIHQGATLERILDLTREGVLDLVTANYVHQLLLIQQVVPHMLERGSGRVINMVSASARLDPRAPAGEGGWGIAYSASKAAFGRVAGGLEAEFAGRGVRAFNVDPGNVVTEKRRAMNPVDQFSAYGSDPPEATAQVVAWLASSPDALEQAGRWIYAPTFVEEIQAPPSTTSSS